jgi:hypothetical protein
MECLKAAPILRVGTARQFVCSVSLVEVADTARNRAGADLRSIDRADPVAGLTEPG